MTTCAEVGFPWGPFTAALRGRFIKGLEYPFCDFTHFHSFEEVGNITMTKYQECLHCRSAALSQASGDCSCFIYLIGENNRPMRIMIIQWSFWYPRKINFACVKNALGSVTLQVVVKNMTYMRLFVRARARSLKKAHWPINSQQHNSARRF